MALNDTAFKNEIIVLQDEMIQAKDYDTAKVIYAEKLMVAIKNYIKSGTVTVNVTTTGTATNHTGTGTGAIS
jgi:PKD repeat protein